MRGEVVGKELVGDIADMDLRAARDEQVGRRAPDARRASSNQDAQRLRQRKDVSGIAHSFTPMIRLACRAAP